MRLAHVQHGQDRVVELPFKRMSHEGKSKSENGKSVVEESKKSCTTYHKFLIENMLGEVLERRKQ
jgi:hypothetical protein